MHYRYLEYWFWNGSDFYRLWMFSDKQLLLLIKPNFAQLHRGDLEQRKGHLNPTTKLSGCPSRLSSRRSQRPVLEPVYDRRNNFHSSRINSRITARYTTIGTRDNRGICLPLDLRCDWRKVRVSYSHFDFHTSLMQCRHKYFTNLSSEISRRYVQRKLRYKTHDVFSRAFHFSQKYRTKIEETAQKCLKIYWLKKCWFIATLVFEMKNVKDVYYGNYEISDQVTCGFSFHYRTKMFCRNWKSPPGVDWSIRGHRDRFDRMRCRTSCGL